MIYKPKESHTFKNGKFLKRFRPLTVNELNDKIDVIGVRVEFSDCGHTAGVDIRVDENGNVLFIGTLDGLAKTYINLTNVDIDSVIEFFIEAKQFIAENDLIKALSK